MWIILKKKKKWHLLQFNSIANPLVYLSLNTYSLLNLLNMATSIYTLKERVPSTTRTTPFRILFCLKRREQMRKSHWADSFRNFLSLEEFLQNGILVLYLLGLCQTLVMIPTSSNDILGLFCFAQTLLSVVWAKFVAQWL